MNYNNYCEDLNNLFTYIRKVVNCVPRSFLDIQTNIFFNEQNIRNAMFDQFDKTQLQIFIIW